MTKRIFRSICFASLVIFVVTFALIIGVLYRYFSSMQKNQLKIQTALAAQGVEKLGKKYFVGLDVSNYRITWINLDGTVIYDSVLDTDKMENHLEREEIKEALLSGYGESSRYSKTLMERSLYSARRLEDGTILRQSIAVSSILELMLGMMQPALAILIISAILSFILAGRLSHRIVNPLNKLNLDNPLENEVYDELSPLLRRIDSQQSEVLKQKNALQRKQDELYTIIESMKEGMVLLDNKGCIISINEAAKKLLDAKDTAVGSSLLHISRNLELQEAVAQAQNKMPTDINTAFNQRAIQISATPVISSGDSYGTAIVFFDITEKEKAESLRREFTANVSHELKTPLQSILGYSELMRCNVSKPKDMASFADKIFNETGRLISLIEDIINLSRLDEGGKKMQWASLDLYLETGDIVKSLSAIADSSGISLLLEGEFVPIFGVPELIFSIVYNLCDNAIKYNKRGGSVNVSVKDSDPYAVLIVKDNGIGIPTEHLDRIFERFYRVDKSHSKAVGGTGLGLSIVKHGCLIHNAKIDIESEVGVGTTVTVLFPKMH